jgi:hypothetical protein
MKKIKRQSQVIIAVVISIGLLLSLAEIIYFTIHWGLI